MKARGLKTIFVMLLTFAVGGLPLGAFAQAAAETIHGQIASIDGADALQVNDDRGFVDSVQLQPGAVINPQGTRLAPGMSVTISGVNRGSVFGANRIDVAGQNLTQAPPPSDGQQGPPPTYQQQGPPPTYQQQGPPPTYQQQAPPAPPYPQPGPQNGVPTQLTGTLQTQLDSKNAYVGQQVILTNANSSDGSITNGTLIGTVTDVTRAGQGRNAQIQMHFDSLRRPNGRTVPIDGVVLSMDVKTKSNAAKEAGGALLGMLAGNAVLKTLFGLSGGGIIGAIGGYFIAKDNRSDVVVPANTAVTVQLVPSRRQS
jgi:hypothetical protein